MFLYECQDKLCVIELQTEENKQQLQVQLQEARRRAADDASHRDVEGKTIQPIGGSSELLE